jgi:hypothetical protein
MHCSRSRLASQERRPVRVDHRLGGEWHERLREDPKSTVARNSFTSVRVETLSNWAPPTCFRPQIINPIPTTAAGRHRSDARPGSAVRVTRPRVSGRSRLSSLRTPARHDLHRPSLWMLRRGCPRILVIGPPRPFDDPPDRVRHIPPRFPACRNRWSFGLEEGDFDCLMFEAFSDKCTPSPGALPGISELPDN